MREDADFSTIASGEVFLLPEELIVPIAWQGGSLRFIDQTRLPGEVDIVETTDWRRVAEAIVKLQVRGAPLIGIAAAYALALAAQAGEDLEAVAASLIATRPTAVNLRWAVERVLADGRTPEATAAAACAIHDEQRDADGRMAVLGTGLLPADSVVLTHCNTGALATGGLGTALGVIIAAHARGRISRVFVDETRPLLQGRVCRTTSSLMAPPLPALRAAWCRRFLLAPTASPRTVTPRTRLARMAWRWRRRRTTSRSMSSRLSRRSMRLRRQGMPSRSKAAMPRKYWSLAECAWRRLARAP